jgi:thiamine-phosphate pyrophosphorylase
VTALLGLAARLKLAKLMLITNTRSASGDLTGFVADAFAGGVDIVQLREPNASVDAQAAALAAMEAGAGRNSLVSAYGPVEIAEAGKANVLQLSAMGGATAAVRSTLGPWVLLGRSCHSPDQVDAAVADPGVAFFTVSPVFNAAGIGEAGMALVRHASVVADTKPWFAVGGINLDNLDAVLAAGARRVGVTRAIAAAADARQTAEMLKARLNQAWREDPGMEQATFNALGG